MDSIRVSEAPDPGSIPGEATFQKISFPLRLKNIPSRDLKTSKREGDILVAFKKSSVRELPPGK